MGNKSNEQARVGGCAAVILAAGRGTRMRSSRPKVLHEVAGLSMLAHVMRAANESGTGPLVIVTAPDMPEVGKAAQAADARALIAIQAEQKGTGDAVRAAQSALADHEGGVLVLCGDSPLIAAETLAKMQRQLAKNPRLGVVVLGFETDHPGGYGRLIRQPDGMLERIVEAKDASAEELAVRWCNAGVMAIRGSIIWRLLAALQPNNAQGEYYLTDIIALARSEGHLCAVEEAAQEETLGVNSRADLARAEAAMQWKLRHAAMAQGVTMIDPASVYLSTDSSFGQDVLLEPGVFIGSNVALGDDVTIRAYSHLDGCVVGDHAIIGPFARLRPGTQIEAECRVGNFVEIKKATLERGAKVSHLSYIGDAHVGEMANIGAGTITCNYDGYHKYHTEIGAESFIGSNTALVAPLVVGSGAIIAAGSVVTEDVPADALAISRSRQTQKAAWAKGFRDRMQGDSD